MFLLGLAGPSLSNLDFHSSTTLKASNKATVYFTNPTDSRALLHKARQIVTLISAS
jgi:hypothetical protein